MPLVQIPDGLCCSITRAIFKYPVVTRDGHSYERSAITRWFNELKKNTSPRTGLVLKDLDFVTNFSLKSEAERFEADLLSKEKFMSAIKNGDLKTLESKPFLGIDQYIDFRPLQTAISSKQLDVLRYLVSVFPAELKASEDLLHHAGTSSPEIVRFLVKECKVPLEGKNEDGQTALLEIICNTFEDSEDADQRFAIITELLDLGANPNASTEAGGTIFHAKISLRIAQVCIKAGADVRAATRILNAEGESIFHASWDCDAFLYFINLFPEREQVIKAMRQPTKSGRSLLDYNVDSPEMLELLLSPPYSLNSATADHKGNTPIHYWALSDEHNPEALWLLEAHCHIDARNNDGRTALHVLDAKQKASPSWIDQKQLIQVRHSLMSAGASPWVLDAQGVCTINGWSTTEWMALYDLARKKETKEDEKKKKADDRMKSWGTIDSKITHNKRHSEMDYESKKAAKRIDVGFKRDLSASTAIATAASSAIEGAAASSQIIGVSGRRYLFESFGRATASASIVGGTQSLPAIARAMSASASAASAVVVGK